MPSTSTTKSHESTGPWKPMQEKLLGPVSGALDEGYAAARGSGMADTMSGYVKNTLDPNFLNVADDPNLQRAQERISAQTGNALLGRFAGSGRLARAGMGQDLSRYSMESMDRATALPAYDLYAKKLALQQGAAGMAPQAQALYQAPGLAYAGANTAIAGLGRESDKTETTKKSNPMGMALTFARIAAGDPTAYLQLASQGLGEGGDDSMWV